MGVKAQRRQKKERKEGRKERGEKGKEEVSFSGFVREETVIHFLFSVERMQISTFSFPAQVPVQSP